MLGVDWWGMTMTVEKISAVTFRVLNMKASVRFYKDILGMEIVYGCLRWLLPPTASLDFQSKSHRDGPSYLTCRQTATKARNFRQRPCYQ